MQETIICITTCNRLPEVKKYIWDYIAFCNRNEGFDFLLALDGNNEEYINFCAVYEIPLLYSEAREGVGLSKNRVLKQFPDYDYYFFIEDDIELINENLFELLIQVSDKTGYQHLCNNHYTTQIKKETIDDHNILHSKTGGAQVALYTKVGLNTVGGWHTFFAKYKRFGHTEHTYRFCNTDLQSSPFIFPVEAFKMFFTHNPPRVTKVSLATNENELIVDEQKIIDQKLTYYPIKTIAAYYFNGSNMTFNETVETFLATHKKRYPLTKGKARRAAFSELYFFRFRSSKGLKAFWFFILANLFFPLHPNIKHYIKTKLRRHAK